MFSVSGGTLTERARPVASRCLERSSLNASRKSIDCPCEALGLRRNAITDATDSSVGLKNDSGEKGRLTASSLTAASSFFSARSAVADSSSSCAAACLGIDVVSVRLDMVFCFSRNILQEPECGRRVFPCRARADISSTASVHRVIFLRGSPSGFRISFDLPAQIPERSSRRKA